jgi:hypothetical protein
LVVAETVAKQAIQEGAAAVDAHASLAGLIREYGWNPVYLPYERSNAARLRIENPSRKTLVWTIY